VAIALLNRQQSCSVATKTMTTGAAAAEATTCEAELPVSNSAFVFIKPHANTEATRSLVRSKLSAAGLSILSECEIDGPTIDREKLIDQHYYAIASKATILSSKDIPVPTDKFEQEFGDKWETVLKEGRAYNAMDACKAFGCNPTELESAWQKAKKIVKFGGGFYCGLMSVKDNQPELYVFNAFFMSMRSKFCGEGTSIYCFEVKWDPRNLTWSAFRNNLLGPTDPEKAPKDSIRGSILSNYKELGLSTRPNTGDNGVHASASPFEGLAEKSNWLKHPIESDAFGKAILAKGIPLATIKAWSVDPRVELPGGGKGSVFDALEDMDSNECLEMLEKIHKVN
jgi:nucleoside diphosphate kinase